MSRKLIVMSFLFLAVASMGLDTEYGGCLEATSWDLWELANNQVSLSFSTTTPRPQVGQAASFSVSTQSYWQIASYSWYVDDQLIEQHVHDGTADTFSYAFSTAGTHVVMVIVNVNGSDGAPLTSEPASIMVQVVGGQ